MDTTITSGNLQSFLQLLEQKKVRPDQFTRALSSGVLADVFDSAANYSNRKAVRVGLGLASSTIPDFERNEFGHIVLPLECEDLTGEQEIARLTRLGFQVMDRSQSCFMSLRQDGYDQCHRLTGKYKAVLMPNAAIGRDNQRSTCALHRMAYECFGYLRPVAGVVPRVREIVSDKVMTRMGFSHLITLHNPILDAEGSLRLLCINQNSGGSNIAAYLEGSSREGWDADGASVFLLS